MKQIYINETPVESVAIDYTDLQKIARRPYTYAALRAHLKRGAEAKTPVERLRVISQIGGVDVEPVAFSFEIREDGVHLFAPSMVDELGAFAGTTGRSFELWALIRSAEASVDTGRIQYTREGGIRCTISERDLLKKINALSPSMLGSILGVIDGAIIQQAEEARSRSQLEQSRVIKFPGVAAGE